MIRVLITGAGGFIGKHLAKHLASAGHHVLGLGHGHLPPTEASAHGIGSWLNGDVDFANLHEIASRGDKIETIYHLAGGSHVGRSFANPMEDFQRTVLSTCQLFDWARLNLPDANIVVTSSAAVYGSGHPPGIIESANQNPYSPYGAHKAMQEDLCLSLIHI